MKMTFFCLFIVFDSVCGAAGKTPSVECKAISWSKSSTMSLVDATPILDKMPRAEVIQLAWGEMLNPDPKKSFAIPVLKFLSATDDEAKRRGYFKAMALMITDGVNIDEAISKWPVKVNSKTSPYNLVKLCQLYNETNSSK